jgi:uncharacterized protein (DUF3820 family)
MPVMEWGKYKGRDLRELPDDYFYWLWNAVWLDRAGQIPSSLRTEINREYEIRKVDQMYKACDERGLSTVRTMQEIAEELLTSDPKALGEQHAALIEVMNKLLDIVGQVRDRQRFCAAIRWPSYEVPRP